MNKKILFLILLIFLQACSSQTHQEQRVLSQSPKEIVSDSKERTDIQSTSQELSPEKTTNTVIITAEGFTPRTITVNDGEDVTWINKDSQEHWPASAVHPLHNNYPEPGGCVGSKFDACKGLTTNGQFVFTFAQRGEWFYHDHLHPANTGSVIVR